MKIRWAVISSQVCFWVGLILGIWSALNHVARPREFAVNVVHSLPNKVEFTEEDVQQAATLAYEYRIAEPTMFGLSFSCLIASQIFLIVNGIMERRRKR